MGGCSKGHSLLIQTQQDEKRTRELFTSLENHFVKRQNVIFKRMHFNKRGPQLGESVESFVLTLYSLAKHCSYGQPEEW